MTGCLTQPDISRDDGLKCFRGQLVAHLTDDIGRQRQSTVMKGKQDAQQGKVGIQARLHNLQCSHQKRKPFQGIVFALQGYQYLFGGHQSIQGKQSQAGRAVKQDEIWFGNSFKCIKEPVFTSGEADQFDLGPGKCDGAGEYRQPLLAGITDRNAHGLSQDKHIVGGGFPWGGTDIECCAGICLWIAVDEKEENRRQASHLVLFR